MATLSRLFRSDARRRSHCCGHLAGTALARALDCYGETVDSQQLYEWLGVGVDEFGHSILERDESNRIKEWFRAHPEIVFRLLDYWRSIPASQNLPLAYSVFWDRLADPPKPAGLGSYLMCAAVAEPRPELARVLFEEAALIGLRNEMSDAPTLDELFAFVQDHPAFSP